MAVVTSLHIPRIVQGASRTGTAVPPATLAHKEELIGMADVVDGPTL